MSGAEEGGPQGGKRTRRGRTNYSREEVDCLEQEFSHSQYVSQFTRDSLSRRLGLTQDQVSHGDGGGGGGGGDGGGVCVYMCVSVCVCVCV